MKFKKNRGFFFEKIEFKVFGGRGTLSSLPPSGAFVPYLTLADFGPRDLTKNVFFCSGAIFGGDMGLGRFALWPTFSQNRLDRFCNFELSR